MADRATPPLALEGVRVVHAHFETGREAALRHLPPAVTTTIPASVYVTAWDVPASPFGPFRLAQVRLGCRAGVRGRGLLLGAVCSAKPAAEALEARWGLTSRPGEVDSVMSSQSAAVRVQADGGLILALDLDRLVPLSGGEVQWPASLHYARVAADGDTLTLVQCDPEYEFSSAMRGAPVVSAFDPGAWNCPGIELAYPIAASVAEVRLGLPALRFTVDPARLPGRG
jgi:hypothetical protein